MGNRLKIAYVLSIVAFLIIIHAGFEYTPYLSIIFFSSLVFSYTGSMRGRLVWLGVVLYLIYMSLHYLILTSFYDIDDPKTLLVLILLLPVAIIVFRCLNIQEIASHFSEKTPVQITAALLVLNVFLILGEIPLYLILGYSSHYHEDIETLIRFLLALSLDTLVLVILNITLITKLLKGKPSGYVFTAVILVMNSLLWFNGLFLKDILTDVMNAVIAGPDPYLLEGMIIPFILGHLVTSIEISTFLLFLLLTFFFIKNLREAAK